MADEKDNAGMFSLLLRNLFFTFLQPGVVAILVPYILLDKQSKVVLESQWMIYQFGGFVVFTAGCIITITCILSFAIRGRGTLSPADPTKKLVVSGLYRYSRNPMYVGVLLVLIGEAIFFQSVILLVYALFVFIAFSIFVLAVEEPRLKRDFGYEYISYCSKVNRWL